MSDVPEGYPSIALRLEPSWTTPHLGDHAGVVVDIEGLGRKVSLVFPIAIIPQHVTTTTCDRWLYAVQGAVVGGCGIHEAWREVLLRLCLAYRAFVVGDPGANPEDWFRFSTQLAIIACHVDPIERVHRLRSMVEWVVTVLPEDVFHDRNTPLILRPTNPTDTRPAHVVIAPDGIPPSEQVARQLGIVHNLAALIAKALHAIPPDAQPNQFPFALVTHARADDNVRSSDPPSAVDAEPKDEACHVGFDEVPQGDAARTARYLTIELPSSLVGSVRTPLVDILQQCVFREVYRDDTTHILPNPVFAPMLCARFPATSSVPDAQSVRGHALVQSVPVNRARGKSVDVALPSPFPRATSLTPNSSSTMPSGPNAVGLRSRIRRSVTTVNAVSVGRSAATEARRQEDREARAARAAARAARRKAGTTDQA